MSSLLASAILLCLSTNVDDVAIQALTQVSAESQQHQVEYGGVIYQLGDDICATVPDRGQNDHVDIHASLPKGSHLVGLYHTHPGSNEASEYFSAGDVETADRLHTNSYIFVLNSKHVRHYKTGNKTFTTDVIASDHTLKHVNLSAGNIVEESK